MLIVLQTEFCLIQTRYTEASFGVLKCKVRAEDTDILCHKFMTMTVISSLSAVVFL
jgi:hypothetical protein